MKAKLQNIDGVHYLSFTPDIGDGIHGQISIPVITHGSRDKANAWTWNGSLESPTIRPSVRTQYVNDKGEKVVIHYWLTYGICQCLSDCTDGNANKNIPLLKIKSTKEEGDNK